MKFRCRTWPIDSNAIPAADIQVHEHDKARVGLISFIGSDATNTAMNTQDVSYAIATDESDAWARHALAASGLSDAVAIPTHTSRRRSMPVPQPMLQPHVDSARYAKCIEVSKRV